MNPSLRGFYVEAVIVVSTLCTLLGSCSGDVDAPGKDAIVLDAGSAEETGAAEDTGRADDTGQTPLGDGFHLIEVPQPGSTVDSVWIYAASPDDAGPHPVVVYGHGQGLDTLSNCTLSGPPTYGDVAHSVAFADQLAAEGYVTVSIFYRNSGSGAPVGAALKLRDHGVLDARAMLSAARWARDRHGRASAQAAFLGISMGSFPAYIAGTASEALADLQQGLDIRTTLPGAMFGNHVANAGRQLPDPATAAGAERASIILAGVVVALQSASGGITEEVTAETFAPGTPAGEKLDIALTQRGRSLAVGLLLQAADPEVPGCESLDGRAPICAGSCAETVFVAQLPPSATDLGPLEDWLTPATIEALYAWRNRPGEDPGAEPADEPLHYLRNHSPVFRDLSLVTPRVLPLLSSNDHVLVQQGAEAATAWLEALLATGALVEPVPRIDVDAAGGPCGHADYVDPTRPACGWRALLDELAAAF